jgi:hypothetical protein
MKNLLLSIPLFVLVSACAPLQQAPLVYSSKVVIGLDLSAAMTESPGASIGVGYKQVDAAYVPVAVAKPCPSTETACSASAYQLVPLQGSNTIDSGNEDTEANQTAAKKLLDDVQKASAALAERRSAEQLAQQSAQTANESLNRLKGELPPLQEKAKESSLPPDQVARLSALVDSEIPKAEIKAKQADIDLLVAKEATARAKTLVESYNIDQLARATKIVRGSDKKGDAYSVFGSFDGATRAAVTTGTGNQAKADTSLIVGKVFSTGIASQFLTQGMRDYYTNMAAERVAAKVVDCLTAVLADEELKKNAAERKVVMEMCNSLRAPAK